VTSSYLSWDPPRTLDDDWQGILRVELDIVGGGATLTVHVNVPVQFGPAAVEIVGGRRITDLAYQLKLIAGAKYFTVEFPTYGDHSTYYVRLLHGGDKPLHPFFAVASFTFTIDCERGDCRESESAAPRTRRAQPVVDLLAKDYERLTAALVERVRATNPSWGDLSPASLERVLLELVAHQGDWLSYMQDRVLQEAFIDSATQRHSLRQHAVLLGHEVFEGQAAETTFAVEVDSAGFVPENVSVKMRGGADEPTVVFHTTQRVFVRPQNNSSNLVLAAWPGAITAQLPAGAREAMLLHHQVRLFAGQRLAFVPSNGETQIVTLTEVEQTSAPGWVDDPWSTSTVSTTSVELTRVAWAEPLRTALSPWLDKAQPLELHANLVDARHGDYRLTIVAETAHEGSLARGTGFMTLDRFNATIGRGRVGELLLRALRVPDGPVIYAATTHGSAPEFELEIDGDDWSRRDHLFASTGFDRHYVVCRDEDGGVWLQFGDGQRGRALEVVAVGPRHWRPLLRMRMHYRVGDPVAGNCARHTLDQLIGVEPSTGAADSELAALGTQLRFTNIRPGTGGQAARSREALRRDLPASIRRGAKLRAVTLADYAEVACQVPGVARAAAKSLGGVFNTVMILIDPEGTADLDENLRLAVHEHIDRLRMAGREHIVRAPDYVPLELQLVVCPQIGHPRHMVREAVLAALRPGDTERPGYFHADRLSFDQDIALSDVLAAVQRVPGVGSVVARVFRRRDRPGPDVTPRIMLAPTEVARLDADPNYPENGILGLGVIGLDIEDESAFSVAPIGGSS
jgi:hypothetical protein